MAPDDVVRPPEISLPVHEELAAAAAEINGASDDLGKPIEAIEAYLASLNIGIPAWIKVKGWEDDFGDYWKRELGYEEFSNEWRLAIRETSGNDSNPDRDSVRTWAFNQSPRKARISAVEKIPELLKELAREAHRTARRIREKSAETAALAATLKAPTPPTKARK